ncbi:protein-export chaperone SecB [Pseudomonadota bacterium]
MKKGISIKAQYLKDLSFESPKTPGIFNQQNINPKIDIAVDIKAGKLSEKLYEIVLTLSSSGILEKENEKIFIIECVYAGIFELQNEKDKSKLEKTLLIDCPAIIFPFARRIIADVTKDGGFPPLMIDPIDFELLYKNRKNKK